MSKFETFMSDRFIGADYLNMDSESRYDIFKRSLISQTTTKRSRLHLVTNK